ncbi:MAG TPA: hypothetical protein PKD86_12080 [Gemmatales bacterium]|nr:hypothetical protein [Gemmatales bacterium]HMP60081.1 hypothetical protein [Gemmatales bacterium]
MRPLSVGIVVSLVGTLLAGSVGLGSAADPKAIIERGLAAAGGKLSDQARSSTWKEKGTFHAMGQEIFFTSSWHIAPPGQYRFDLESTNLPIRLVFVLSGDQAWQGASGMVEEVRGEKLAYAKNQAHQFWVTSLYPLLEKPGFRLALAGEADVEGKPAVGVRVSHTGQDDITLYFDKGSGLLVKLETLVMDEFSGWAKVKSEAFFQDYYKQGERMVFRKLKVLRDGKLMIESEMSEPRYHEQLDEKLFEKPEGN